MKVIIIQLSLERKKLKNFDITIDVTTETRYFNSTRCNDEYYN